MNVVSRTIQRQAFNLNSRRYLITTELSLLAFVSCHRCTPLQTLLLSPLSSSSVSCMSITCSRVGVADILCRTFFGSRFCGGRFHRVVDRSGGRGLLRLLCMHSCVRRCGCNLLLGLHPQQLFDHVLLLDNRLLQFLKHFEQL